MNAFPVGLGFEEACEVVQRVAAGHRLPVERLALSRLHGRIVRQDVASPMQLPPFDNSAMDGFALRHRDIAPHGASGFHIVGEQFAGRDRGLGIGAGECVRVTTGAPLPAGADSVVVQEATRIDDGRVFIEHDPVAGANVRRAGEDVAVGDPVFSSGMLLTPARVALAASLGLAQLDVSQRPTVAVFTTGDELVEPGLPLHPGEIHNSNRELLMGLLRADGFEPTAWPTLPDHPERLASALRDAASSFDVVISCGAVSTGAKDHVPALLREHGIVHFWKVRMKPGMPLLFGQLGRAQFLGLPGNPVSVLATYLTLGRRLLDGMQGRSEPRVTWRARMAGSHHKRNARREFLRGRLLASTDGSLQVVPDSADGSHRLAAAARSDALIVLSEGERCFDVGDVVEVLPY